MTKSAKIRRLVTKGKSPNEIAKALKVNPNYVHTIMWLDRKKKKKPSKILKAVKQMDRELNNLLVVKGIDKVNHPPHYRTGGIETIDFIEAKDLNYRLGNVVKYVSRAGRKLDSNPVEDLEKAAWYLNRELEARRNA